jgi:16S rRNA (cytidine1402-2'-O)-methyltransferase
MSGTLYVVATPIGNLEDITARALRVLREVSLIAAEDTRRTARLLARYAITTPTTSLHEHNERAKSSALIQRLLSGQTIALVSDAGTPTVSDPGARLIRAAIDSGVRVEAVPGPSATLAALAISGLSTETFTFLGFPPTRSNDRLEWFERARQIGGTVIFFEAPHRIIKTLSELYDFVGDVEILVGRELTKAHEESVRGPISDVLKRLGHPRGEFTVVTQIGRSASSNAHTGDAESLAASEFELLGHEPGVPTRQALRALGKKYSRPTNELYKALLKTRNSGK